jgi:hypothetical protein
MFTDPTLSLYRALGLTRQTGDAGPDAEAGDYLVQTAMEATVSTIKRATQMPLRNPGHFTQLGGEFIFDGTLNVAYTHRMWNTRSHAPIRDICALAGVRLEWVHYEPGPSPPPVHRMSLLTEEADEEDDAEERAMREASDDWKVQRDKELARIQAMKEARRAGVIFNGDVRREVKIVGADDESDEDIMEAVRSMDEYVRRSQRYGVAF